MGKARSRLFDYKNTTFRTVRGFTTEMHLGKQGKHLPGHEGYSPSKSTVTLSVRETQNLIDKYAGTGHWMGTNKEIVNFGKIIGIHKDLDGNSSPTTQGTIHYSKSGAHLVPAKPDKKDKKKK